MLTGLTESLLVNSNHTLFRFPAGKRARTVLPWIGRWRTACRVADGVRKGRKAEDGRIDAKNPLKETPSASYLQRSEWNARYSDATVLFSINATLKRRFKKNGRVRR
jgi:hypothetical protein